MTWVMLGVAGIFEVVWATFMKLSEGFTKLGWTLLTFAGMAVSFALLARDKDAAPRHGLRRLDGDRRAGFRHCRHSFL